jgi:hypothetical protein
VEAELKEGPTGLDNKVQLVGLDGISEEDESEQPSSVRPQIKVKTPRVLT